MGMWVPKSQPIPYPQVPLPQTPSGLPRPLSIPTNNNDPGLENGSEEQEDHSLVKKLLGSLIGWLYGFMQLISL